MARCGCAGDDAGEVMRAAGGLSISGSGTVADPRRLALIGDDHLCGVFNDCVTDKVCRGLEFADGCLGLKLSGDQGNTARITADGGLYGDCTAGGAGLCANGVSTLPAFIVGGANGAGMNVAPASLVRSVELAVAANLDMSAVRAYRTADRSFVIGPSPSLTDGNYVPTWSATMRDVATTELRYVKLNVDAAYGWPAEVCSTDYLTEALNASRGNLVLAVECLPESTDAGAMADLVALLARECATDKAIVFLNAAATVSDADRGALATARTAGYETGFQINTAAEATTHTPAKLVADQVRWVFLHVDLPDATIQTYVAQPSLQCLLYRPLTHTQAARATSLGMRGILSEDPAYASKRLASRAKDSWCYPSIPSGQIASRTIQAQAYRTARGFKTPDGCGWRMPEGVTTDDAAMVTLLGWAWPLPDPTTYTLTWEMRIPATASRGTSEVGLVIGCPTDTLPMNDRNTPPQTKNPALTDGYVLRWKIGQTTPTVIAPTLQITRLVTGLAPGPSSTAVTAATTPVNGWVKFQAIVTPTSVRFGQFAGSTLQYVTELSTTLPAATPDTSPVRGHYIWAHKWEQWSGTRVETDLEMRNFLRT